MRQCVRCRSYAINPHMHDRKEGEDLDLCDVCYWRKRSEPEFLRSLGASDSEPSDAAYLKLLEIFAAGCFSGMVAEWPQLKPTLAWAAARIHELEAFCLTLTASVPGFMEVMREKKLSFENLDDPMQKLAFSFFTEIVVHAEQAEALLGKKDGGGVSLPDKVHGVDEPRPGTTVPK